MLITDFLKINAQKHPNSEAIVYIDANNERLSMSWKEFDLISNQVANFLKSENISKGDKVGILLQNLIVWLPIYFGILKSGAVAVLLNYNNSIDEIEYCVEFADCKCVFTSKKDKCYTYLKQKDLLLFGFDNIGEFYILLKKYSETLKVNSVSFEDIAAIYFSSGTTGRSKAILISHLSLVYAAQMEIKHHNQSFGDRFLCVSPLYHTGAKIHWFGSLVVGGSIVLYNSPISPKNLINIIEKEQISITFLLVPQIQDIIDALDMGDIDLENYNLRQWRLMHSGAQHIPQSLIIRWHRWFPLQAYDTSYGLTESTGPGCIHLGTNNIEKAGSIGKPDSSWEVDIINEGKSVVQGSVGELTIKGPGIMVGYYKDRNSTNEVLINGWLYTGDMAYMDQEGFIYIVGRKKDVIISGGENIYPVQIENFFRNIPNIKDVAVIGIPNDRMGELVAVIIELRDGHNCTKKYLIDYCSKLPAYQRPLKFVFGKIIRNSLGKPDKKEMSRRYFNIKNFSFKPSYTSV